MSKEEILNKLDLILEDSDFKQQKEKTKYIVLSIFKELNITNLNIEKENSLIDMGNANFIKGDKLNLISNNKNVRSFNIKDISKYKISSLELLKLKKSYIIKNGKETNNIKELLKNYNKENFHKTTVFNKKSPVIGDIIRTKKKTIGKVLAIVDDDYIIKDIKNKTDKNLIINSKDIDIIYFDNKKGIRKLIDDVKNNNNDNIQFH